MFRQHFQDPLDYLFMFLLYLCKDQNIVQVYYYDLFSYEGSENVVHHSLRGSRAVGHSKEHHEGFKEAVIGVEGYLPFISRLDAYIVETPLDIKFYEVLGFAELEDKFRDEGDGVFVLDGYSVQHTIVLDQLEQTIFFLNEEHRGCYGGLGWLDASGIQVFLQESI